jgi:hypothetical protein
MERLPPTHTFVKKSMKKIWFPCLLVGLLACGDERKQETAAIDAPTGTTAPASPAATPLEAEIGAVLNAYYGLKEALVEADSLKAGKMASELQILADSLDLSKMEADSTGREEMRGLLGDVSAEAKGLAGENSLTEQRRSFSMLSQQMLPLLREAGYASSTVWQQTCPMAFNDSETASWLSDKREIRNPYLGMKHPKYAAGMLHCGELGDSIVARTGNR